ncbi:serine acetyltransferase [Claveliimonas bilis]|uniref:serine O-acetyltransferase n=1 Tax=Claveliimonas bilis TaxID=3028070 RepID=UPI002930CC24|nr:serine acetyltransferase [Claveliimonas bilis]
MIKTKQDLLYYLECDKVALKIPKKRRFPRPILDLVWNYEIIMRKAEYYGNVPGPFHRLLYLYYYFRFKRIGIKLSISIGLNTFGPGLRIPHYGTIVVNGAAEIGENCCILECVNIGATNGSDRAPQIGNNVFIGSGAKIIGDIIVADGCTIGTGAVVVKSILKPNSTVVGVPATVINYKGSDENIVKATEIVRNHPYGEM